VAHRRAFGLYIYMVVKKLTKYFYIGPCTPQEQVDWLKQEGAAFSQVGIGSVLATLEIEEPGDEESR